MTPAIDPVVLLLALAGLPTLAALLVLAVAALPRSWQPIAASALAVLAVCLLPVAVSAGV